MTKSLSSGRGCGHVTSFKFWEIIDNISETMQDSDAVTTGRYLIAATVMT